MTSQPRYVIAVQDLARTTRYWHEVLGFEVRWQDVAGWRLFVRDGCLVMAGECPDASPASALGDHSYFAYVQVDDIDGLHAELTGRGVECIKPLRDEAWGMREFGIRTVDGHRMMFGQPSST